MAKRRGFVSDQQRKAVMAAVKGKTRCYPPRVWSGGIHYVRLGPYDRESVAKQVAGRERVIASQIGFAVRCFKRGGKWYVYREVEP